MSTVLIPKEKGTTEGAVARKFWSKPLLINEKGHLSDDARRQKNRPLCFKVLTIMGRLT